MISQVSKNWFSRWPHPFHMASFTWHAHDLCMSANGVMPHFLYSTTALSPSDDSFSQIVTKEAIPWNTHEQLFLPLAASSALWASLISFIPLMGRLYTPKLTFLTFILFLIMCLKGSTCTWTLIPTEIRRIGPRWEIQVAVNHLLWVLGTNLGFSARKACPLLTVEPFL